MWWAPPQFPLPTPTPTRPRPRPNSKPNPNPNQGELKQPQFVLQLYEQLISSPGAPLDQRSFEGTLRALGDAGGNRAPGPTP